jgi:hypothetical protein
VAFDPSTNRLYVVEDGADTQAPYSYLPVIQVYQLTLSSTQGGTSDGASAQPALVSMAVTAGSENAVGSSQNLSVNLSQGVTPLTAGPASPSAGEQVKAVSASANTVSIPKRLPAQETSMARTNAILRFGKKTTHLGQSASKQSAALHGRSGLENEN